MKIQSLRAQWDKDIMVELELAFNRTSEVLVGRKGI